MGIVRNMARLAEHLASGKFTCEYCSENYLIRRLQPLLLRPFPLLYGFAVILDIP
jgi:hypothetical protein